MSKNSSQPGGLPDQIPLHAIYGGFTVSATARDPVLRYIANQDEHHRKLSFREELIDILQKAGIEFDPRYLD